MSRLNNALLLPQNRIWELDLLKGIAFVFMVWDHAVFDLWCFFDVKTSSLGWFEEGIGKIAAALFMLVCGISVTLGRKNIRHGAICFSLGMALTVGTYIAELITNQQLLICFGILHFLGISMIIGHFAKKLPNLILALLSVAVVLLGIWFQKQSVSLPFLFPFGLTSTEFYSSDYFPLFPNLAYTFVGLLIGKLFYRKKTSLLNFKPKKSLLCLAGRHTLVLYFVHQPLVIAILFAIIQIKNLL